MEQLEARLRGRGTEAEEQIQTRLANAAEEMVYGTTDGNFDFVLINDDLKESFQQLVSVIQGWYPNLNATTTNTTDTTTTAEVVKPVESNFHDIQLKDEKVSYRPIVFCGPSGAGKGQSVFFTVPLVLFKCSTLMSKQVLWHDNYHDFFFNGKCYQQQNRNINRFNNESI